MICEKCEAENLRSRVIDHGSEQTLFAWQPYWDEDGEYHAHDPNKIRSSYECSNGHTWTSTSLRQCRNCEYGGIILSSYPTDLAKSVVSA